MSQIKITTNNRSREPLTWHDLTPAEQAEFDLHGDRETASYVRAYGNVYSLSDCEALRDWRNADGSDNVNSRPFRGWDGAWGDSFFSGVLVRYTDDGEVVTGRYIQ